ncbi:hypothetical protein AB0M46_19255 [Dactylosporangium sp. NPDC051485]|uniref:hypothetical protein n=1 Tax=Dactylosporangium sp. NPDC051485 TaxID=3154846 RepID=UPI00342FF94A
MRLDDDAALDRLRREVLPTLNDDRALSLCVVLVERASAYRGWAWGGGRLLADLNRRALPWTAADAGLLFDLARSATGQTVITVLKAAVNAAERLDVVERSGCVNHIRHALERIDANPHEPSERARLRLRLALLIESAGTARAGVRTGMLHVEDGWSQAALECLSVVTADVDVVSDVLTHAATIPSGPRPTKSWLKRTGELLAGRPGVVALVRELLELAHTCEPAETEFWGTRALLRIGSRIWSGGCCGPRWWPANHG